MRMMLESFDEDRLHKAIQNDASSVAKKVAYHNNICQTVKYKIPCSVRKLMESSHLKTEKIK